MNMKQAEDKYTMDMIGDTSSPKPVPAKQRVYRAYVETDKGGYFAWEYLTLLEAKKIYNLTLKRYARTADDVKRQGWEEMR
jgi:hypothetical protein